MPSQPSRPSILLRFAPWVAIIIVAIVAYHVVGLVDQRSFRDLNDSNQEYISSTGLNQCLSKIPAGESITADQMKSCLQASKTTAQVFDESLKPRIEELKWLLTIIATIGGFFAIAQGAASWFSAQIYTRQAEEGLKAITAAQEAIKAKYPLFEHVESIRKEAIAALNNVFTAASKAPDSWAGNTEALDWEDNLFRILGVEARQKLLSVESFTSIDLDPAFSADEHADILRKFSLFYRAKYLYEDSVTEGSFDDLERAEAYLILASQKKPDFTIKNDLGSLYGTIFSSIKRKRPEDRADAEDYLSKSETAFRQSLRIEPDQQRAHYSLGVISGRHRKQYREAVAELEQALQRDVWQRERSDYMLTIMYYNMACYQSRLLQEALKGAAPVSVSQAQPVILYLGKAAGQSYVRKDIIKRDYEDNVQGDFTGLLKMAAPELKAKLGELRATLESNADRAEYAIKSRNTKASTAPQSLRGALAEAAKLIRNALTGKS